MNAGRGVPESNVTPFKTACFAVAVPLFASGCAMMSAEPARTAATTIVATATLRDAAGHEVGKAELRQAAGWSLAIGVSGQTPGAHGIHLHTVGACDAPDFASAKGHLNPDGRQHGSANPAGMHQGDIPNLEVGADGTASVSLPLSSTLDLAQLFDADGTALVIHAGADDYRTDPSGNSGGRVACGVLRRAV